MLELPEIAIEDRNESEPARGNDGRGTTPARKRGDLTEYVARSQLPQHRSVLEDVRSARRDCEERVPEVAFAEQRRPFLDVHFATRFGHALQMVRAKLREQRDLREAGGIHRRDAITGSAPKCEMR